MGFMGEISEYVGKLDTYEFLLERCNELEKQYIEKYGVAITEMYEEIYKDIIQILKENKDQYKKLLGEL